MKDDFDYSKVPPSMVDAIRTLREHNFKVSEYGDGTSPSDELTFPYILIDVEADKLIAESHRLLELIKPKYPKCSIDSNYNPEDKSAFLLFYIMPEANGEVDLAEPEWN